MIMRGACPTIRVRHPLDLFWNLDSISRAAAAEQCRGTREEIVAIGAESANGRSDVKTVSPVLCLLGAYLHPEAPVTRGVSRGQAGIAFDRREYTTVRIAVAIDVDSFSHGPAFQTRAARIPQRSLGSAPPWSIKPRTCALSAASSGSSSRTTSSFGTGPRVASSVADAPAAPFSGASLGWVSARSKALLRQPALLLNRAVRAPTSAVVSAATT